MGREKNREHVETGWVLSKSCPELKLQTEDVRRGGLAVADRAGTWWTRSRFQETKALLHRLSLAFVADYRL